VSLLTTACVQIPIPIPPPPPENNHSKTRHNNSGVPEVYYPLPLNKLATTRHKTGHKHRDRW
jgi:hypothetical protein